MRCEGSFFSFSGETLEVSEIGPGALREVSHQNDDQASNRQKRYAEQSTRKMHDNEVIALMAQAAERRHETSVGSTSRLR